MSEGASRLRGWRGILLALMTLACVVLALFARAVPQPLTYHAFADCRTIWSVPNFFNVVSNLPFLVAGVMGLTLIARGEGNFQDPRERLPYLVFFMGAVLTTFGSAWYHLAPDNPRLVWDRLPMTLGFAGLTAATVIERVDPALGRKSLPPLLTVGLGTVLFWYATERAGRGNLLPYAIFQGWSVLVIVFILVAFPVGRHTRGALLGWAAIWYALAKLFEAFDLSIYRMLGGLLSGHTIKHVLAAGAVFAIVRQLRWREARIAATQ